MALLGSIHLHALSLVSFLLFSFTDSKLTSLTLENSSRAVRAAPEKAAKFQYLYFSMTDDSCPYCTVQETREFRPMRKVGWAISVKPSAQIRLLHDQSPEAEVYNVRAFPTFILIKDGKIVFRHTGVLTSHQLLQYWNQFK